MTAALWILSVCAAVLVYGVLYAGSVLYPNRDVLAGAITTVITIFYWGSPLSALRLAAADLDSSRVPIPLTLSMILTTGSWLIVGVLVGDMALIVCSAFGISLSTLQLFVIFWIKLQRRKRDASEAAKAAPTVLETAAASGGGASNI